MKELCENALIIPNSCDIFSPDVNYTYEFWEFVENLHDDIKYILENVNQDTYEVSFTY